MSPAWLGVACAIAAGALSFVHADDGPGESTAAAPAAPELARAGLVGGQSIVGRIVERQLTVRTLYGELVVPFDEVVKVEFGLQLPPESELRLKELVAVLEKDGPGSETGREALAELEQAAMEAVPALRRARARTGNEEVKTKLGEIIEQFVLEDDVYLGEDDRITAERFTMAGRIVEETFHIESLVGALAIPRRDLRDIVFRETEIKKSWSVGPSHLENQVPLVTKVKVRKGQRITLEPSGTMNYQGNAFGPLGMTFWRWNSRNMGCLQWRVGEAGAWNILGDKFEGRAPASGVLQFCLHLTDAGASGEFEVKFSTTTK